METWKDIRGYEGIYVVSSLGRVASLNRVGKDKNGREVRYKGKMLLPHPNSSGYLRVELKRGGTGTSYFVHRLVALHFVENLNPDCYSVVHHLDGDHLNNKADNLEWTTIDGNNKYAIKSGRMERTKEWLRHLRETNEKNGKSVIGTNVVTGKTIRFECLNDCKAAGFQPSCVCNCCTGIRKSHKGFTWRYATPSESKAKGLGIQTETPDQIAEMKSRWGE